MSEYQYYEFQAIDQALDAAAQAALRAISTRARITSTSFINHYEWGNLKADPHELMARWFDLHLYLANWGTRVLMVRIPRRLFDPAAAEPYAVPWVLDIEQEGENVILTFQVEEHIGDEWDDGPGWLAALSPLRAALMEGDQRCLYLAWLMAVQRSAVEDSAREPPRPPGLARPDGTLQAFMDFFGIDSDLFAAAAEGDADVEPDPLRPEALEAFIRDLPAAEKGTMLLRVAQGKAATLASELRRRCRAALGTGGSGRRLKRRTVAGLRRAAEERAAERRRVAAERAAAERARQEREEAEARARRLDALAGRGEAAWQEVEDLIATKQPARYDQAVALLADLRALSERAGTAEAFRRRLAGLRERHARKPSLVSRLDRAELRW